MKETDKYQEKHLPDFVHLNGKDINGTSETMTANREIMNGVIHRITFGSTKITGFI